MLQHWNLYRLSCLGNYKPNYQHFRIRFSEVLGFNAIPSVEPVPPRLAARRKRQRTPSEFPLAIASMLQEEFELCQCMRSSSYPKSFLCKDPSVAATDGCQAPTET